MMAMFHLLLMSDSVALAAAAGAETLVTAFHRAYVRFLSSVRSQVLREGALLVPSFTTSVALEGFLSRVNTIVNDQVSWA